MYWEQNNCEKRMLLNNTFRKLWEQHIMWTRSFIISTVDNLGDLEFVTQRLMRNPADFQQVLKRYYGDKDAATFKTLLEDHLNIAGDLVNQALVGNTDGANATREKWYKNAGDIASFLSSINPYWDKNKWLLLLDEHLKMTENEAVTRIQKKYQENVSLYDSIENQALDMADYMTHGIIKQFM